MFHRPPKTTLQTEFGIIEITSATTDDAQELFDLCQEIVQEEVFFISLIEDQIRTSELEFRLLEYILQTNFVALVAKHNGIIVGSLYLIGGRFLRTSHVGELEMKITKQFRSLGIGKQMLKVALYEARQRQHISRIKLSVMEHNTAAIALYQKFGFLHEGILHREVREITGEYRDIICMGMEV